MIIYEFCKLFKVVGNYVKLIGYRKKKNVMCSRGVVGENERDYT